MSDGYENYKKLIDEMVCISHTNTEGTIITTGSFPKVELYQDINTLLEKLSVKEREAIAKLLLDCRSAAIFDVLSHLEWLRCCHDLKMSEDNMKLIMDKGQGFSDDYIMRLNGREWPK